MIEKKGAIPSPLAATPSGAELSGEKQIEEMAEVYYKARLKARETLGSMNEGEEMWYSKAFFEAGYRKQSENETLEAVDKFRSALMDKFIDICEGNDYNKINLLRIGDTIQRTFYDVVARLKGGAE